MCQPGWEWRVVAGSCLTLGGKCQEHEEFAEAVSGACNLAGAFTSPGLGAPSAGSGWLLSQVGPVQKPVLLPAGTSTRCWGGVVLTTDHQ